MSYLCELVHIVQKQTKTCSSILL